MKRSMDNGEYPLNSQQLQNNNIQTVYEKLNWKGKEQKEKRKTKLIWP